MKEVILVQEGAQLPNFDNVVSSNILLPHGDILMDDFASFAYITANGETPNPQD